MEEFRQQSTIVQTRKKKARTVFVLLSVLGAAALIFLSAYLFSINKPPNSFPIDEGILIAKGSTVRDAADLLAKKDVVRSSFYLQFLLKNDFGESFIRPGAYNFPKPLSATKIAEALTTGKYSAPHDENIVTFPEGFRIKNMYQFLPDSYKDKDLTRYRKYEGYLFPDTYFIEDNDTLDDITQLMRTNFDTRIAPLQDEIDRAYYSLEEIITLASILEREGNSEESMRMIAGILITRLEEGMPLQVDAAFDYILDKTSAELTEDDLTIDSPYNTYKNTGLPPTPISNPGIMAIEAVLNPMESEYYYYLSDSEGNFHYAKTFDEHKQNKFKYLR